MSTRSLIAALLCSIACSGPGEEKEAPVTPATPAKKTESKPAEPAPAEVSDDDVLAFLESKKGTWRDANVPFVDGKVLHDLVVKNQAKRILEIGTSTGHSTIWLAWAAKKVGGHVVTIEIDKSRYETAKANIEAAGLTKYVTFHLGDAHELVPELPGPHDFVFSDADKDWYINYFKAIDPKMSPGGCIAAHNALNGFAGVDRYVAHVRKRSDYKTTIDKTSRSGFAISCKVTAE